MNQSLLCESLVKSARGRRPPSDDDDEDFKRPKPPPPAGFKSRYKEPKRKGQKNRSLKNRASVQKPRRAKLETLLAFDLNLQKADSTLRKYRNGYYFAHSIPKASAVLLKAGFKGPNNYYPKNQHLGRMFGLPREVPRKERFGEEEAGWVLRHCLEAGATESQADGVKKMLSYAYQLQTGNDGNFDMANKVWKRWDPKRFGEPTQSTRATPETTVTPENYKEAMTKEWHPGCGIRFVHWNTGYLLSHDWGMNGLRSKEELCGRVKNGRTTVLWAENVMWTKFRGGRPKMNGWGARAWRCYRRCLCPDGKHDGPPANWRDIISQGGIPDWCTTCPISAYKVVQDTLGEDDGRIFPLHTKEGFAKSGSMGKGTMFPFLQKWLTVQGANPDNVKFHTNMGRKCLGRLCDEVQIPYPVSFEAHGDQYKNWKHYQEAPVNDMNFTRREQSLDIRVATRHLEMIGRWFGRGPTTRKDPPEVSVKQLTAMIAVVGRKMGVGDSINRILDGNDKKPWE